MAASSSSSAEISESKEAGFHPAVVGKQGLTKMAADSFTDGLLLQVLQGRHAIIMVVDPNTGKVVRSLCSAPELMTTATEMKTLCESNDSQMSKDLDKIHEKRKSFATTDNESRGSQSRIEKLPSRSQFLLDSMMHFKLFFGTIKPSVPESASVKKLEQYLRLYAERGHPLPAAVWSYLNNKFEEMQVESTPWELPIIVAPPEGLSSLLPLMFDPINPTSMTKKIFGLRAKDKNVSMKQFDGRKGAAARGRALHARRNTACSSNSSNNSS